MERPTAGFKRTASAYDVGGLSAARLALQQQGKPTSTAAGKYAPGAPYASRQSQAARKISPAQKAYLQQWRDSMLAVGILLGAGLGSGFGILLGNMFSGIMSGCALGFVLGFFLGFLRRF